MGHKRIQGKNFDANTTYQSVWHNENSPNWKRYSQVIVVTAHIQKTKWMKTNNIMMHFKIKKI